MPKKSELDERITNLFAGLHPEEHINSSHRASWVERKTAPVGVHSGRGRTTGSSHPVFTLVILSIAALSLLTAFVVLAKMDLFPFSASTGRLASNLGGGFNRTREIPDKQPPTTPVDLKILAVDTTSVKLGWSASSDDVGVVGYTIYRNGVSLTTVAGSTQEYTDAVAGSDSSYDYALDAFDKSGNHSALSNLQHVNTPALPGSLTYFLPTADTYVNSSSPDSVYGDAPSLRVDAVPDIRAYLRFDVTGLNGKTIHRARLLLFTNSDTVKGLRAFAVADNTLDELTTTYKNAPAVGKQLSSSMAADTVSWISLDLTGYITSEGSYSVAIVADSITAMRLDSREAGTNSPKLVLDLR